MSALVQALIDPNNIGMSEADYGGFGSTGKKLKEGLLAQLLMEPVRKAAGFVNAAKDSANEQFPLQSGVTEQSTDYDPRRVAAEFGAETAMNLVGGGTAFAQPGAAGIFGGKLAKTANAEKLAQAEGMAAKGANRDEIWNQTGWFRGADNKWRFEIPDDAATFHRSTMHPVDYNIFGKTITADTGTASSVLRHDQLWDAYPDQNFMTVVQGRGDFKGQYSPPIGKGNDASISLNFDRLETAPEMRSTMLHEMQHAIQEREGFARGANPESLRALDNPDVTIYREAVKGEPDLVRLNEVTASPAYKAEIDGQNEIWKRDYQSRLDEIYARGRDYTPGDADQVFADFNAFKAGKFPLDEEADRLFKALRARGVPTREPQPSLSGHDAYDRIAGEVESRNVQKRMNMTPDERRASPPWTTQDYPDQRQIVRFGSNGGDQVMLDDATFDLLRKHGLLGQ
jgi:hypothetical protein